MLRTLLLILCLLPWVLVQPAVSAEESVRIGVLAKRGDQRTINRWQPTADYLGEQIPGYRFTIVPLDFEEIGEAVAANRIDFVLANSAIYVEFETLYGAGRIATMRNLNGDRGYTLFGGVIFTRADRNDINTLQDIEGKRFAAVKSNSLGGYLMGRREMEAVGIVPSEDTELTFPGTHDAVVYNVLRGLADAGTVRTDTLERMSSEGKIDLTAIKVLNPQNHVGFTYLSSTRLYPEWPFAKLKQTPDALSHAVATALLRMQPESRAARAGLVAGWTVPRNYQPVHELMRELHVGPYRDLGKITLQNLIQHYWHWLLLTLLALLGLSGATVYVTRLNLRLRETESELLDARDNLAQKVQERTGELEESHRRLERISRDWNDAFDAISDPIFIHDKDMRIVQANPAYCDRAGKTLKEMLGKPYYHFFPRLSEPLPACSAFPEQFHSEGDELELESGELFVSRSFGIKRADNTVVHALHILEDVTAVRRAEARRRVLSRAVEQAGEGILILDSDRRILYGNPGLAMMLGRDKGEECCDPPLGGVQELVTAHFSDAFLQLFADVDGGKFSASTELELAGSDGKGLPVLITVGAIFNEEEQNDGYVLSILDLSEVREAEEELTYRIGFESVIADIASRLVNVGPERLVEEVNTCLEKLGEFASADRAYLFDYDAGQGTISNTNEWCAPGIDCEAGNLQSYPFGELPWLRQQLLAGEVVIIPNVATLPEEAKLEREEFLNEEIASMLVVPLHYSGVFSGFIGFDNVAKQREWQKEDVNLLRTAGEIVINSVGRVRATSRVQFSEASLAEAQRIAHVGNWNWNILTGELSWSDEIYRIFGLQPQEFGATYEAFLESVHPDDREMVMSEVNMAVAGEKEYAIDHRIVRPDGSERIVHEIGGVSSDEAGRAVRMIGTVQDVTELRQAERETSRLNRALRTLSLCNTTLVHASDEQALMEDICNILIDNGGYRFAWVGYAEEDKRIRPVAHAGYEADFLHNLNVTWDEDQTGQSPAGHAIREGKTYIARDIAGETDSFTGWREAALESGYVSVISLPLISQGETFGAITIDAVEANAFDTAELRLLEEMAGDLAFGIRTLRSRQERDLAEAALKETEERYEELYENAPNAYLSVSAADGSLLQFNQSLTDILGYSREQLQSMHVLDLYADGPKGVKRAKKIFANFKNGKGVRDVELQMRHADGHFVWVSVSIDPVCDDSGKIVESRSMIIDISARKQAEEERSHFADQLQRSLLQTIRAIALTIEKRDPYTAGHQERVAELAVKIAAAMGLDEHQQEGMRLGALIHDIGKISVPAEILNRPGKLEPEMFSIIKTHPMSGYEIISGVDFPWPLAEMVLQHHERLDGSGYPNGLKGDEISMEARILAVADVVEAMASHRPYRASLGFESALEEIEKGAGIRYDKHVVDACVSLFREQGDVMEEWINSVPQH